jgi:four helix bundle suffix protein
MVMDEVDDMDLTVRLCDCGAGQRSSIAANAIRALTIVACSLLDCRIKAPATAFEKEGGLTERLFRVRSSKCSFT